MDNDEISIPPETGKGAKLCVFEHKERDPKATVESVILINALFPPKKSTVHEEHKNKTSREINKITHNYDFFWNDLYPWAQIRVFVPPNGLV